MNAIALACLVWTVAAYWLAKKAYARKQVVWRSPALTVPALTIALMLALGISYEQYQTYTHWIVALLGPATVAFAIPIYQYRAVIRRQMVILGAAVVVGMVVGVGSAFVLAHLFHFNEEVTNSLMARSISTPFAIVLADQIHGSATLVSLFTVMTGLVGMIFGDIVLAWGKFRFHLANGAAFGNAAHGFGTFRAGQRHSDEGVIASLTMILAGLFMVLAGPSLVKLIVWLSIL
jgi:putative effector of murein hydrolase